MRVSPSWLYLISLMLLVATGCQSDKDISTTQQETWVPLFNGTDLTGWTAKIHHYPAGENFGQTFRVSDSMIQVRYDQYQGDYNDRFGHLYYDIPFSHFHLKLEYRFTGELHPGAPSYTLLNSGVMFHSQSPHTMLVEQNWPISVEMQFLAATENEERPTGNMCSPGTDVVFEGKVDPRHCISSSSNSYAADQWVSAELLVFGDSLVSHIIEGDTVLQYSKPTIGGGVAEGYDPVHKVDGAPLTNGHIALQSEGQPIDFRRIVLRDLSQPANANMD